MKHFISNFSENALYSVCTFLCVMRGDLTLGRFGVKITVISLEVAVKCACGRFYEDAGLQFKTPKRIFWCGLQLV